MDTIFKKQYLNANYNIIVEDDVITTAKVYIGNEFLYAKDFTLEDGGDVPYTKRNYDAICEEMNADIRKAWEMEFNVNLA